MALNSYEVLGSEKEEIVDSETMVELVVSKEGFNLNHKIWELSIYYNVSFQENVEFLQENFQEELLIFLNQMVEQV
jgi:hypothetical protein